MCAQICTAALEPGPVGIYPNLSFKNWAAHCWLHCRACWKHHVCMEYQEKGTQKWSFVKFWPDAQVLSHKEQPQKPVLMLWSTAVTAAATPATFLLHWDHNCQREQWLKQCCSFLPCSLFFSDLGTTALHAFFGSLLCTAIKEPGWEGKITLHEALKWPFQFQSGNELCQGSRDSWNAAFALFYFDSNAIFVTTTRLHGQFFPQETWEMLNLKELSAIWGRNLYRGGCSVQIVFA